VRIGGLLWVEPLLARLPGLGALVGAGRLEALGGLVGKG